MKLFCIKHLQIIWTTPLLRCLERFRIHISLKDHSYGNVMAHQNMAVSPYGGYIDVILEAVNKMSSGKLIWPYWGSELRSEVKLN